MEQRTTEKIAAFDEWMGGDHVLLHLDARSPEVKVPGHLKDNPALTLKLSYYFEGKTEHDEDAVITNLRFSGKYERCIIPWGSIWGITSSSGERKIWTADVPTTELQQPAAPPAETAAPAAARRAPALKRVK
jgi:hypothetical protein